MIQIKHRIELVKLLPKKSIAAEVGVAEGNFSFDLLEAGVGVLYSIDNWRHIPGVTGDGNFPQDFHDKNYETAKERLSKYGYRSLIFKGLSVDMAAQIPDNSLELVYLDGAHYYSGVLADLKAYYPKLKPGGIMAGHDYLNPDYGVKQAVEAFIFEERIITTEPFAAVASSPRINVIEENNYRDASFYFIKP